MKHGPCVDKVKSEQTIFILEMSGNDSCILCTYSDLKLNNENPKGKKKQLKLKNTVISVATFWKITLDIYPTMLRLAEADMHLLKELLPFGKSAQI